MEQVTIEEAIKKGNKTINYPVIFILFGLIGLTIFIGLQFKYYVWVYPIGFIISFVLAWIFWSIKITKWKIWAFENVRNVHELRKRAIEANLIYEESSFLNKTEIWNSNDKEKWNELQIKFDRKDEFVIEEDLTILPETIIYYSKGKNYLEMVVMLGCLALGIYLIFNTDNLIFGIILSLIGAYFSYKEFKEATNTEPQIILNEDGIQTITTEFCNWKDIEYEDVEIHGSGKHTNYFLTYKHLYGSETLLIDDYEIDYLELRKLLKIYRSRSIKKNNNH